MGRGDDAARAHLVALLAADTGRDERRLILASRRAHEWRAAGVAHRAQAQKRRRAAKPHAQRAARDDGAPLLLRGRRVFSVCHGFLFLSHSPSSSWMVGVDPRWMLSFGCAAIRPRLPRRRSRRPRLRRFRRRTPLPPAESRRSGWRGPGRDRIARSGADRRS